MAKKYSNCELQKLANSNLIWVKKSEHYDKLLRQSVINKGWDASKLEDMNEENDLIHEELWWDVCGIVNDLAQIVLDEREKRAKFLNELKSELKNTMNNLTSKRFDEYY